MVLLSVIAPPLFSVSGWLFTAPEPIVYAAAEAVSKRTVFTVAPAPRLTVVLPFPPSENVAESPVTGAVPPTQFVPVAKTLSVVPVHTTVAADADCAAKKAAMEPARMRTLRFTMVFLVEDTFFFIGWSGCGMEFYFCW